jgi:hypothetical protein
VNRDKLTDAMLVANERGIVFRVTQAHVPDDPGYLNTDSFELVRVTPPEPFYQAGCLSEKYEHKRCPRDSNWCDGTRCRKMGVQCENADAPLPGVLWALVDALERGHKLSYTGALVVTDPDGPDSVQMVLDEDDFKVLKAATEAQ